MKRRSGGGEDSGGTWLNTYADMVTLLLCFFVLLYAISSVDQAKFEILVKSFNPNYAKEVSQIVTDTSKDDGDFDIQGSLKKPAENSIQNFDDLYYTLVSAAQAMGLSGDEVQIRKEDSEVGKQSSKGAADGAGATASSDDGGNAAKTMNDMKGGNSAFITFKDSVFFRGDDSRLTPEGKKILKKFSSILGQANDIIGEVDVLGHTSQGDPKKLNNIRTDFTLSALRSMEVIVYLTEQKDVDRYKFVGQFFGQNKAISGFDTAENRSKNRRVEILILRKGTESDKVLNKYYDKFYKMDIRDNNFRKPDEKSETAKEKPAAENSSKAKPDNKDKQQ